MNVIRIVLCFLVNVSVGQSINNYSGRVDTSVKSFEVGTFMGENLTMNLMLAVRKPDGVTIRIKDADNAILYEQRLKKSPIVYHHKLSFKESKPGVYQVEITDGRQTVVRRIEVVDMPAIQSQRYVTYQSLTY